jgi:SAM-dependent methyltransferase
MSLSRAALEVYAAHGAALADRYEAVDAAEALRPVADLLPAAPARVLDVGAGSGRDAAWLAGLGHAVTALEPAAPLRAAGAARHPGLDWRDGGLPSLAVLGDETFDVVLANAVWHHLDPAERDAALVRLAGVVRPGGRLMLSLRQGPLPEGQPVAAVAPGAEIARAEAMGFTCLRDAAAAPRSDAPGIAWHWLVLERSAE